MITTFVDRFLREKETLRKRFELKCPESYEDIVREVITVITGEEYGDYSPDPERIHTIDDGHYQGTLVFVIAAKGYQPSDYWYVKVAYGSCPACDTLEKIRGYSENAPTTEQVNDYMTLALHIVQGLKSMQVER